MKKLTNFIKKNAVIITGILFWALPLAGILLTPYLICWIKAGTITGMTINQAYNFGVTAAAVLAVYAVIFLTIDLIQDSKTK